MPDLTGQDVVDLANNNSLLATEPAVVRGIVVGAASGITTILVLFGVMGEDQRQPMIQAVGETAFWGFTALTFIVPVLQALWTRLRAFSPRTAAEVAVSNFALGKASMTESSGAFGAQHGPTMPA